MGPELVYVSGRKRPIGEMNGKSGNLNNVASQLYPEGCTVPSNELLCIFDADQASAFVQRDAPQVLSGETTTLSTRTGSSWPEAQGGHGASIMLCDPSSRPQVHIPPC